MALLTFLCAVAAALVVRGPGAVVGVVVLAAVFVPLERCVALHRIRVLRRGLLADLTHLLLNATIVAVLTIVGVVVSTAPLWWVRAVDVEGRLPAPASVALTTHGDSNRFVDVTEVFDRKLAALLCHESQHSDPARMEPLLRNWGAANAEAGGLPDGRIAEAFRAIDVNPF